MLKTSPATKSNHVLPVTENLYRQSKPLIVPSPVIFWCISSQSFFCVYTYFSFQLNMDRNIFTIMETFSISNMSLIVSSAMKYPSTI